jgi:hypothetical protein
MELRNKSGFHQFHALVYASELAADPLFVVVAHHSDFSNSQGPV